MQHDLGFYLRGSITGLHRETHQGKSSGSKYSLDQLIPCLPISPIVAFVIQFDAENRPHGLRLAKHKIHVFTIDAVGERAVFPVVACRNKKQIP